MSTPGPKAPSFREWFPNMDNNKLIIFDCDGVLVDSEIIANRFEAEMFTAYGYPITAEECIQRFTGLSISSTRELVQKEAGLSIPLEAFNTAQQNTIDSFEKELIGLMGDVLENLNKQRITRCVASSSPRHRVIYSLQVTKQLSYFDEKHIFTSQQVSKGKPAPDLFLFAAEKMGFNPKNCIVIEDSLAGVEAAKAAGMNVVGFIGGSHARFDWYRKQLINCDIPIMSNSMQILSHISQAKVF